MQKDGITEEILDLDPTSVNSEQALAAVMELAGEEGDLVKKAQALLEKYPTAKKLYSASIAELEGAGGIGRRTVIQIKTACLLSQKLAVQDRKRKMADSGKYSIVGSLYSKKAVTEFFKNLFEKADKERMYGLFMNRQNEIIAFELLIDGFEEKMNTDPVFIMDSAIRHGAKKVVLAHNHFDGIIPSSADVVLTSKLVWLLGHMRIDFFEHYIFYKDRCHLMVESGEMTPLSYNLMMSEDY